MHLSPFSMLPIPRRIGYLVTSSTITTCPLMWQSQNSRMYRTPDSSPTKNQKYTEGALAFAEMTQDARRTLIFATEQHLNGWKWRRHVWNWWLLTASNNSVSHALNRTKQEGKTRCLEKWLYDFLTLTPHETHHRQSHIPSIYTWRRPSGCWSVLDHRCIYVT